MNIIDDAQIHQVALRVLSRIMGGSHTTVSPAADSPLLVPDRAGTPGRKLVAIGSDHGGFDLKEIIKLELDTLGFDIKDVGATDKNAVDYPDLAHEVAKLVGNGTAWRGIMIDGAGIGSCIVANKVPGVRAGMAYDHASAVNGREHNDTNVLTLGAGMIGANLAKQIVTTWLATKFGGGRHAPRVGKITDVEQRYLKGKANHDH